MSNTEPSLGTEEIYSEKRGGIYIIDIENILENTSTEKVLLFLAELSQLSVKYNLFLSGYDDGLSIREGEDGPWEVPYQPMLQLWYDKCYHVIGNNKHPWDKE